MSELRMVFRLSVIDEEGLTDAIIGILQEAEMELIIEAAKKYAFRCLRFVSCDSNTYFSEKQQYIIMKELQFLEQISTDNQDAIALIRKGLAVSVKDSFSQLKFEPIHVQSDVVAW